jgi:indolepyruvate ferredoxin oxidoreductase beta subunit
MSASGGKLPERALTLVIGALGGEGGGVLADWIVHAVEAQKFPVQSTSIPGVAQRTGATTYYVEIYPATHTALAGRSPVMALYATPGNMDMVIASELMEAGRMLEMGWVTPARTTMVASSHRVYSITEKSAMGNGLFDTANVVKAANKLAKRAILFDLEKLAQANGSALNAVMLGVIAGSGELPVPESAFEDAIKASGVAVDANLRGFRAGLGCVKGEIKVPEDKPEPRRVRQPSPSAAGLIASVSGTFPAEAHSIVEAGLRRVADYQDDRYAALYFDRLEPVFAADKAAGGASHGFKLTQEVGRYLALWMTFEDIIRVAELKARPERMARVRREVGAKESEPVVVTEFLKPGYEEFASVMPPKLGRAVLDWAQKSEARKNFHLAMRVKTNTVFGFARLHALAKFKFWRPRTLRFHEENREIETWLEAVKAAVGRNYGLAVELAELPNLRKGYSDTNRRGIANYRWIFETLARPAVAGAGDPAEATRALARARQAALADQEGVKLAETMAALGAPKAVKPAALPPPPPAPIETRQAAE